MISRDLPGLLLLEDGRLFRGRAAVPGTRFGEVVFNTSMTGYQEILTDPSYRGQIVVMTQPHIGNYGVEGAAEESSRPQVEGFVARNFTRQPSSHASEGTLPAYLERHGVPALEGIDTRAVVRHIRKEGALRGVIASGEPEIEELARELEGFPTMTGRALALEVTCDAPRELPAEGRERAHLALLDFGAKANIVRSLRQRGARLTILPATTPAEEILRLGTNGVVLSNGPGDPEPLRGPIETIRELLEAEIPVLGICLGHQLLGLALGGRTYKMKFGHHGGNQPVLDLATGKTLITSQNHGFAVDPESLPDGCRVTQRNLNDDSVEAFDVEGKPVVSVQYHPEAAPGPREASAIFDRFVDGLQETSAPTPSEAP
ncbi:MAG: glutamine-hydrolyzing carbamoyl-phosphate synthase small subunit [Thermoanaerobaculia bacterium]|nr:glutamine-hydrolyzing carbamoyl-phosphate synthase small subunit [Thermoanaerobaculia bacterium]